MRPYAWCDVLPNMHMPNYFTNSQNGGNDNSWVDNYGEELGKRNLTFLSPEEKPSDKACLDTLNDEDDKTERFYFEYEPLSDPTVHNVIEVTIGYYLHTILQQKAKQTCVYCVYLVELYRRSCHSCIDILPLHYLEGHLEEIKQEIFNENYTNAQTFKIEKILSRKRRPGPNMVLVKWVGWPDKFNSLISEKQVIQLP